MIDLDVKMTGFDEAAKMLDGLPFKVRKKVLKGSLRRGAMVFQKAAKANIQSKSGTLKRSIRVRIGQGLIAQAYAMSGGAANADGWYAHIVEDGAQAHSIKSGASVRRGKKQDGKMHPGFEGKGFMRKAAQSSTAAAITAVAERFEELLMKELNL